MSVPLLGPPKVDEHPERVARDFRALAPKFAAAVASALNECHWKGWDAVVFEAARSDARQQWLFAQGRTRPGGVVTYASSALHSWHGFGLAVDVVSRAAGWDVSPAWRAGVVSIFTAHGLDWGGRWTRPDYPHWQWGTLKPAPSDRARALYAEGGLIRVWQEVNAA